MFKFFLHKNYLFFGGSIIIARALEYAVLFFAAQHLDKNNYGELEYYKKIIEVGSSIFAFGFPALLVSYTRSIDSKKYFFLLSTLFVFFLSIVSIPILGILNGLFLLLPFVFYALFFNGGITPAYLLVFKGSNSASIYKIIISVFFYFTLFVLIYYYNISGKAYVITSFVLLPLSILFLLYELFSLNLFIKKAKKYWKLFKKLLLSSSTLVISNFANMMFLYTDIFILKIFSSNANTDIANFSFALNISNMLILIPLTLVQVDVEKLKKYQSHLKVLNKRILILIIISSILLIGFFKLLTATYFIDFKDTYILFLFILSAKIMHALSTLFGTNLLILKKFRENLIINISMLLLNIILCYIFYKYIGINGVAIASGISLSIRYFVLVKLNKRYVLKISNETKY